MVTASEIISHAIGYGLVEATFWVPISYFCMRKQFGLRKELRNAWKPYLICAALFSLQEALGFSLPTDTQLGLITFFIVPLSVCAGVLYLTYRNLPESKSTKKAESSIPNAITSPESDTIFINENLGGKTYRLKNENSTFDVSAIIFSTLLTGLKSQGLRGASNIFSTDGQKMKALEGAYEISSDDAKEITIALQKLLKTDEHNSELAKLVYPIIAVTTQGAFTVLA